MEKLLVKLTWLISLFILLDSCIFAESQSVKGLSQNELGRPESVRQWLRENADNADTQTAEQYY